MKKINGFTLAEVLITLVIIGIIAAMTIPSLMNKTNEQETVVAVKKAYSVLSQACLRMVADYGELNPSYFGRLSADVTKNFGDAFVKYLNVQKNCGVESGGDCWSTENGGMYKFFDGSDWVNMNLNQSKYYLVRLNDGMSLLIQNSPSYTVKGTSESLQYSMGHFIVDVNGDKGPNTSGKDVFRFWITKYGIVPIGTLDETMYTLSDCRTTGRGCTAWVVMKGNMDYLRKDVSW